MATKYRYITVAGEKPLASQMSTNETVINEADGTMWYKTSSGTVIQVGRNTGGAGVGIDEMVLLQGTTTPYTAPDGSVYLRSGTVERNTSLYPLALVRNDGSDYVGSLTTYTVTDSGSNILYYFVRVA